MKKHFLTAICGLSLLSYCGAVNAQVPIPGQAYQVPDGYTGYAPGTVINYGGFSYVIQTDATMLFADQGASQAYQVPDGYSGYVAGTVITYGGANYVLQGDGTMVLSAQGDGYAPDAGQVYQVPDGYSGYAAGTVINYGGANYTIGLNGTMVLVSNNYYLPYYGRPSAAFRVEHGGGFAPHYVHPGGAFSPGPHGGFHQNNGWTEKSAWLSSFMLGLAGVPPKAMGGSSAGATHHRPPHLQ